LRILQSDLTRRTNTTMAMARYTALPKITHQ